MKINKLLWLSLCLLIASPLIYAEEYGNPRMHQGIASYGNPVPAQVIDLAKCYSSLKLIDKGITFDQYYNDFLTSGLNDECEQQIADLGDKSTWYVAILDDGTDTDGDGFTDIEEKTEKTNVNDYYEYPWWIDIDGDGFSNDYELSQDSDPLNMLITPTWKDTDGDGYNDEFELERNSDPNDEEDVPPIDTEKNVLESKSSGLNWKVYVIIGIAIILLIVAILWWIYWRDRED